MGSELTSYTVFVYYVIHRVAVSVAVLLAVVVRHRRETKAYITILVFLMPLRLYFHTRTSDRGLALALYLNIRYLKVPQGIVPYLKVP